MKTAYKSSADTSDGELDAGGDHHPTVVSKSPLPSSSSSSRSLTWFCCCANIDDGDYDDWWMKYNDDETVLRNTVEAAERSSCCASSAKWESDPPPNNGIEFPLHKVSERLRNDQDFIVWLYRSITFYSRKWSSTSIASSFQFLSQSLRENEEFVVTILCNVGAGWTYVVPWIPDHILQRDEVVFLLMSQYSDFQTIISWIPKHLWSSKDLALQLLCDKQDNWPYERKNDPVEVLQHLDRSLRDDLDVMLMAVVFDGNAFKLGSERVRSDCDIVLTAMMMHGDIKGIWDTVSFPVKSDPVLSQIPVLADNGFELTYPYQYRNTALIAAFAAFKKGASVSTYMKLGFSLKSNVAFAMNYLVSGGCLGDVPEILRNHRVVVLAGCAHDGIQVLTNASDTMKMDRLIVSQAVKTRGRRGQLEHASDVITNDKWIMLEAVRRDGSKYDFVSDELKGNPEIICKAIKYNGLRLQYAPESMKRDFLAVLTAVSRCGDALQYACNELRDDYDIVKAAVRSKYTSFQYASERLRDDANVVLAAMEADRSVFQYASERLKDDTNVVVAAMKARRCSRVLLYASERMKDSEVVILAAIKADNTDHVFHYASQRLKDDENIVLAAIKADANNRHNVLQYASERLMADENFVLAVIGADVYHRPDFLHYASTQLKDNENIVLAAINAKYSSYFYASDRLKRNGAIAGTAISASSSSLFETESFWRKIPTDIRSDLLVSNEFHLKIAGQFQLREFRLREVRLPDELMHDSDFLVAYFSKTPRDFHKMPDRIRRDVELVTRLVTQRFWDHDDYSRYIRGRLWALTTQMFAQRENLLDVLVAERSNKKRPNGTENKKRQKLANDDGGGDAVASYLPKPVVNADAWYRAHLERVWLVTQIGVGGSCDDNPNSCDGQQDGAVVVGSGGVLEKPVTTSSVASLHSNSNSNKKNKKKNASFDDIRRHILSFVGRPPSLQLYNELKECEPVINCFIEFEIPL